MIFKSIKNNINNYIKQKQKNKAFVILFTIVLCSIILAITMGVANVSLKEIKFNTSTKDSSNAFFAADIGAECALLNDQTSKNSFVQTGGSGTVSCLGNTVSLAGSYPVWTFVLSAINGSGGSCAKVTVDKTISSKTVVTSKGYNIGDSTCASSSTNRVERELQVSFANASPLGVTWTARTSAGANSWSSVAYGNGVFVAVSYDGRVMKSSDGINWSYGTATAANTWTSVAYGNGVFVAVSYNGTNRVMTSVDGNTWVSKSAARQYTWTSVTYGNGRFVAVSYDGADYRAMYSSDNGNSWTIAQIDLFNWNGVATNGSGRFVAVGFSGKIDYSTNNGAYFNPSTVPELNSFYGVAYGNGKFVTVSPSGVHQAQTSTDGSAWVVQSTPAGQWLNLAYGGGIFVSASYNYDGRVITSPDGVVWTLRTSPSGAWRSIAYGNGIFVAVDEYGGVMTSP